MKRKIQQNSINIIVSAIVIGIIYCFVMPRRASWDIYFWKTWTMWIHDFGLGGVYNAQTVDIKDGLNYHPFMLYLMKILSILFPTQESLDKSVWVFKILVLPFDLVGAVLAMWFLKPVQRKPLLLLLFLGNIGYMYNTVYWAQCDAVFTTFVALSIYFLTIKPRLLWAWVFYVFALQTKMQAIIFLPILGLLSVWHYDKWTKKEVLTTVGAIVATNLVILLPFILSGSMPYLWKVYTGGMGFYTEVTKGSFNIWTIIFGKKASEMQDTLSFAGVTYHHYGLLMFCLFSAITLFPLLMMVIEKMKNKATKLSISNVIVICALIPMVFYFFNTQMHERYIHPMVLFWGIYALLEKKYLPFFIASFLYFLNLDIIMQLFIQDHYDSSFFDARTIAVGYLGLMCYGWWKWMINVHFWNVW